MSRISIQFHKTSLGELILGSFEDQLCLCDWRYRKRRSDIDKRIQSALESVYVEEKTGTIQYAVKQLDDYFTGGRNNFDIPILMSGSAFQKSVWHELLKIPYGETRTYLEMARILGNEKSIRAVASANGANALSIFIPCHRIIGSDGNLTGYAGGLEAKRRLLHLESALVASGQLSLF